MTLDAASHSRYRPFGGSGGVRSKGRNQRHAFRRVFFETLESRSLLALAFVDQHFLGGLGDQRGTDVSANGGKILQARASSRSMRQEA